jgi:putative Flp pilus-assembly TadE/G-like protein
LRDGVEIVEMTRFRSQRGQVLVIVALMLPTLVAMAGMAIDVGSYASDRTTLQNAADSIALAASQELPDTGEATAAAEDWAARNNIDLADLELQFTGQSPGVPNPKVRVTIERSHEFHFMGVVGINEKDVAASATSMKASYGGGDGIVPWSVTQDTVDASPNGSTITMKYDADGGDIGNFGAIRIDGPGANTYNNSVKYGSSNYACAQGTPNCTPGACPGTYPEVCAETSPECDGPDCTPQTGNLVGPTATGVDYRMNNASTDCDSFAETFSGPDSGGRYFLDPQCNPWIDGGSGGTRVIIIPIVDTFGTGASDPATITGFALVYLEGYDAGKCQGNSCEIKGRFVRADLSANALAGIYNAQALVQFSRLTE